MEDHAHNTTSNSINPSDLRLQLQKSTILEPRSAPLNGPSDVPQYPPHYPVSATNPLYAYGTSLINNSPVPTQRKMTFETFRFQGPATQVQSHHAAPQREIMRGQSINPNFSYQLHGPPKSPSMERTPAPPPHLGRQHGTSPASQLPSQSPIMTPCTLAQACQASSSVQPGHPSPPRAAGDCSPTNHNPTHLVPQVSPSAASIHATTASSPRGSAKPDEELRPLNNAGVAPHFRFPSSSAPSDNSSTITFANSAHIHSIQFGLPSTSSIFVMPDRLPSSPGRKRSLEDPFRDAEEAQAAWAQIAEQKDQSVTLKAPFAGSFPGQKASTPEPPVNGDESAADSAPVGNRYAPGGEQETLDTTRQGSAPENMESRGLGADIKASTLEPSQHPRSLNVDTNGDQSRCTTPNPIIVSNNMINLPRRSQPITDRSTGSRGQPPERKSEGEPWTKLLPDVKVMPSPRRSSIPYQACKEEIKEEIKEYPGELVVPTVDSTTVTSLKHDRSPSIDDLWLANDPANSSIVDESRATKRRRLEEVSGAFGRRSENLSGDENLPLPHPTAPHGQPDPSFSQRTVDARDSATTPAPALSPAAPNSPPVRMPSQGLIVSPHARIPFTSFSSSSSRRPLTGIGTDPSTPVNRKRTASPDADPGQSGRKRARVPLKGLELGSPNDTPLKNHAPNQLPEATRVDTSVASLSPSLAVRPDPAQRNLQGVASNAPRTPKTASPTHDLANAPRSVGCSNLESPLPLQSRIQCEAQDSHTPNTPNPETPSGQSGAHGRHSPASHVVPDSRRNGEYAPRERKSIQTAKPRRVNSAGRQEGQESPGHPGPGPSPSTPNRNRYPEPFTQFIGRPDGRPGANVDSGNARREADGGAAGSYSWRFGDNHWHPTDDLSDRSDFSPPPLVPRPRVRTKSILDTWRPSERSRSRSPISQRARQPTSITTENQWSPHRGPFEHSARPRSPPTGRRPDDLRAHRVDGDPGRPPPHATTPPRRSARPLRGTPIPPHETPQRARERAPSYSPRDPDSGFQARAAPPSSPTNTTKVSSQRAASPIGTAWTVLSRRPPDQQGGHTSKLPPTEASFGSRTESEASGANQVGTSSRLAASIDSQPPRRSKATVGRVDGHVDRPHPALTDAGQTTEPVQANSSMTRSQSNNHVQPDAPQSGKSRDLSTGLEARSYYAGGSFVPPSRHETLPASRENINESSTARPLAARLSSSGLRHTNQDVPGERRPSLLSRVATLPLAEGPSQGPPRNGQPPPPQSSLRDRIYHPEPTTSDRGHTSERVSPLTPYYGALDSPASHSRGPAGRPRPGSGPLVDRVGAPRDRGSSYRGGRPRGRGRGTWNRESFDSQRR